jgi:hypothetical protein
MRRYGLNRPVTGLFAGLLLGLAVACGTPASAQTTLSPEQACRDDAFRLCNEYIPDRDKTGACLKRKARSLSKDCRTVIYGSSGSKTTHRTYHKHYHKY